jgi:vacuolar protein sorting-associated protein VTA1
MLSELLRVLERMKDGIGASEAVDLEAVSYAYVEKFALKVYTSADTSDRDGIRDK